MNKKKTYNGKELAKEMFERRKKKIATHSFRPTHTTMWIHLFNEFITFPVKKSRKNEENKNKNRFETNDDEFC